MCFDFFWILLKEETWNGQLLCLQNLPQVKTGVDRFIAFLLLRRGYIVNFFANLHLTCRSSSPANKLSRQVVVCWQLRSFIDAGASS